MPTPATAPDLNGIVTNPAHVNQFLGTHGAIGIYEGVQQFGPEFTGITTGFSWPYNGPLLISGALGTVNLIDQPFKLAAGTTLSRVEIPVQLGPIPTIRGQPISFQDFTVSIYTDAAGVPGVLLGEQTVPGDWLLALSNGGALFPDQNTMLVGPWTTPASLTPPVPMSTYYGTAYASDGVSIVAIGGMNTTNTLATTTVFSALMLAGGLAPWLSQPVLPAVIAFAGAAAAGGCVVVAGGANSAGAPQATVWTATLDASGALGGWLAQTPLPAAVQAPGMTANGNQVYVCGGATNAAASTATNAVRMATVNSNGQITAWTTLNSMPTALFNPACAVVNGWLVVEGGQLPGGLSAVQPVYAAPINPNGTLGQWRTWTASPAFGPAPWPMQGGHPFVVGDTLIVADGGANAQNEVFSLTVGPAGPARRGWEVQPQYLPTWGVWGGVGQWQGQGCPAVLNSTPPWIFIPGDYAFNAQLASTGACAPCQPITTVSVPFNLTGLVAGTLYHVVIGGSGNLSNALAVVVALMTPPALPSGQASLNAGVSWITIDGGQGYVPIRVYNGTNGRLAHIIEDSAVGGAAKHSWLISDVAGKIIALGEYAGAVRSWRQMTYDPSGLLVGVA